jgi:alpha-amylase/alpha-mannosidase (GH57 family)
MILPLANRRDKWTQVAWGIEDFKKRFNRMPEGMWLAETAVDTETLDIMAQQGIKFTILAPYQAKRVRKFGGRWRDVAGGGIDPSRAYRVKLGANRQIDVFFYDGPISRAVAFEGLLANGETFAQRLLSASDESRDWPELLHIATDGETYGHHHRYGEMALTYALQHLEEKELAKITNYGEYLEKFPPNHEAEIFDNTAWSCAHGVERWNSDCGCNSGRAGWNQAWREPLRQALDWLRDCITPLYEQSARQLLKDPWIARDRYIDLILDRSPENRTRFLAEHARDRLDAAQEVTLWKLLELQRHAMLMYTSCGWFFDELSGIETVQVIQYAGRVVHLAAQLFEQPFEQEFTRRLAHAKSNIRVLVQRKT